MLREEEEEEEDELLTDNASEDLLAPLTIAGSEFILVLVLVLFAQRSIVGRVVSREITLFVSRLHENQSRIPGKNKIIWKILLQICFFLQQA